MTTQSPDQSLSQSPAPKDVEELKEKLWDCILRYSSTCMGEHDRVLSLSDKRTGIGKEIDGIVLQFAAEITQEREAELAEVKALAQLFGKQEYINRLPADWFEDSSLETWFPLTAQTFKELKRELAEAREFLAGAQRDANEWNRRWEDNQTKLVNLSAAYQRQKEALERCKRSAEREIAICEGLGHASAYWPDLLATINAALAETPDVSMWKPIDSAPKDGTRILALWPYSKTQCWFETFWDDDESQGDKPGWYAPEWGCLLDGYNPTHWQPLPPPLTLQPDHQK